MTRDEAIYTLEQMKTWSKDFSDDEIEAINYAMKCVFKANREPTAKENLVVKWIPVTERLPEDSERVLITYDIEDITRYVKLVTYDEMRGRFYDDHALALEQDCITAWMPLPKPYKEGDDDGRT